MKGHPFYGFDKENDEFPRIIAALDGMLGLIGLIITVLVSYRRSPVDVRTVISRDVPASLSEKGKQVGGDALL